MGQHQELRQEVEIGQPARNQLEVRLVRLPLLLRDQPAHVEDGSSRLCRVAFTPQDPGNGSLDPLRQLLVARDDPDRAPYLMTISRQDVADKSVRKVTIPITHAEAAVLETALRAATTRILGW